MASAPLVSETKRAECTGTLVDARRFEFERGERDLQAAQEPLEPNSRDKQVWRRTSQPQPAQACDVARTRMSGEGRLVNAAFVRVQPHSHSFRFSI